MNIQQPLLIGIMVLRNEWREAVLKVYLPYHSSAAVLFAFTPEGVDWRRRTIRGICKDDGQWVEKRFPYPDCVYNRCFLKDPQAALRLQRMIGRHRLFNSVNRLNKWQVYQVLAKSEIRPHVPRTYRYPGNPLGKLLEKHRLLFLKPHYGSKGKGVYRIEARDGEIAVSLDSLPPRHISKNVRELGKWLNGQTKRKAYMAQQGLSLLKVMNEQHFDTRVLVQKDRTGEWQVSNAINRVAHPEYYNTSIWEGLYPAEEMLRTVFTGRKTAAILMQTKAVALYAVQQVERRLGSFGELGVDFGIDPAGHVWLIEMNGMPEKELYGGLQDSRYLDLAYTRPLEYAYYVSEKQKEVEPENGPGDNKTAYKQSTFSSLLDRLRGLSR